MQGLAAAAVALLIGVSIVVGFRLFALHRRSGAAPELLLGLTLLLSSGLGYPLLIAAHHADADAMRPLLFAATVCFDAGFMMLFAFTWRVFRPQEAWARVLVAVGAVALIVGGTLHCWNAAAGGTLRVGSEAGPEIWLEITAILLAFLWTAWESLRYHGFMRKRVALGLADPAVCDHFLLWGLMALFGATGLVLNNVALVMKVDILTSPWVLLASSGFGLAQAVLLVLAFAPPSSYVGWVRAHARAMET